MLTREHRQEALSRAYIQAVAGMCGLSCSFRDFDYGIDMTLHSIRRIGTRYREAGHPLDIQAKSTTASVIGPTEIAYDTDVRTHDLLRTTAAPNPRILVLVVLPVGESDWVTHAEGRLSLNCHAYWLSLRGRPKSKNKKSVRISIPRSNVLSPAGLSRLMHKVRRKEPL